MSRVALIGGGGFAKEVAEVLELNGHEVVGCVDDAPTVRLSCPHWGPLSGLDARRADFECVALGIGATDRNSMAIRAGIIEWIRTQGYPTIAAVSPHAVISRGVKVSDSVFVAHGVVVSVDAQLDDFVILNSHAIVGHDAQLASQVIVAPGAFIGGAALVGAQVLIGPGAQVLQGLTIGDGSIVSVGTVVLRSLAPGSTVVPQRPRIIH